MKLERLEVKACCGTTKTAFKISSPISKDILPLLVGAGFVEAKNFTKAGMLYVENEAITVNAPFGQNTLHITCKIKECAKFIDLFQEILLKME